jgi:RNA recognition motif. (a.k.a. RRM, RBD, or RNP domain)
MIRVPGQHNIARLSQNLQMSDGERIKAVNEPLLEVNEISSKVNEPALEVKDVFTPFLMCSACKSAYLADDSWFKSRGFRVKCGICDKEWFQSVERLMKTDNVSVLGDMSDEKIADVKRILADNNWPKYPRVDKIGLFVGNLPYSYDEKDLLDLFAEYGVTGIALVRDPDGVSKGFAFIEVIIYHA